MIRLLAFLIPALLIPGLARAQAPKVTALKTPDGVAFALLGEKKDRPAPTLFVFATAAEQTLTSADYNRAGQLLAKDGCLCVSLDVPCHGADAKKGEAAGLDGWRARLAAGTDVAVSLTKQASAVLDHLIKEEYTDAKRVAVIGTSRGGFMALHWAAAEPRVGCVAAFAPVTDLLVLREFRGMEDHAATKGLALIRHADKLPGRPMWVCIGNNDDRVSTDHLIAFTRKVVAESTAKKVPAPVELHVMPTVGHRIHDSAHAEAAAWIAKQWRMGK